ncbi:hypothetical protein [Wolbachia endosymbiont of Mansonella perstans]|uniref:hypothetical protein n=1 Tax=Wolbachia endosymbiont of Mansonella perstans TaxID=229526 RepID=UPI001CE21CCA|nr:hypothetical protein [Wolbachia endosymbiont of Mansonella perstans]
MQTTLKNHLVGELLTIAYMLEINACRWKSEGFTDYDEDLSIDNILYKLQVDLQLVA